MREMMRESLICEALKNWSKKTTLKAISPIMNSKSTLTRALWTSFILLFAVILAQKLHHLITDYFNYDVVTQIELVDNSTTSSSSTMSRHQRRHSSFIQSPSPTVTIRFIDWLDYNSYLSRFGKINITDSPSQYVMMSSFGPREAFDEAKKRFLAAWSIDESRVGAAGGPNDWYCGGGRIELNKHLLLNSIVTCRVNGVQNCSRDDFDLIDPESSSTPAALIFRREFKSLRVEISLDPTFSSSESPVSSERGLQLVLGDHRQHEFLARVSEVDTDAGDTPIFIRPGRHHSIRIDRTSIYLLPEPFNKCIDNDDDDDKKNLNNLTTQSRFDSDAPLYQQTIDILGTYSQKYCYKVF